MQVLLELELEVSLDHLLGVLLDHHSGKDLIKLLQARLFVHVEGFSKVKMDEVVEPLHGSLFKEVTCSEG